jgi:CubicO group peptidase (beta-lactamase class C family)
MMRIKRIPILAFALLLTAGAAVRADNIDEFVKAEIQKQHIAGVSIAVIKDGKIVKVEGYGLANIELNVPAKPETVYKIGSVSK